MEEKPRPSQRHVLVVSEKFPPSQGGTQAAAAELASMFADFGCRVSVATTTAGAVADPRCQVHALARNVFSREMAKLLVECKPDVVLVNGLFSKCLGFDFHALRDYPVVYRSHGMNTSFKIFWDKPPFFGLGAFVKSFLSAFRLDCILSDLAQNVFLDDKKGWFQNFDVLLAKMRHPGNVSFIPNAVPSLKRTGKPSFRLMYGLDEFCPLFLCVANFCDRKGQIDAVKSILRHPELDAQFVFIGSECNGTSEAVERLANGDSRITVLNGISRPDVASAINCCDAAFLFARQEQQPIFLIEAMSCGKPWFCTDVGSVANMKGGIVLRRRNERCFVDAARELLSETRRRSLGAEGHAFWEENYSPPVVHAKWKRLLGEMRVGATHDWSNAPAVLR